MFRNLGCLLLLVGILCPSVFAAADSAWQPLGPYGGDVRSLAAQPDNPSRLFLGTSNSQVYSSSDGGRSWAWWSQISERSDYVVNHLLVDPGDPAVMYAGVWSTEVNGGGGVFKSIDGGRTWRALPRVTGESVRSLTQWGRDPRVLVAGAISGVFRTRDAGGTWERISPAGHEEIRNIESVSIDPRNADTLYAGTWHLAWKTSDGGKTWGSIREGMIDDSDVFSIQPDWSNPQRVYASACSGIYRSDNGGALWTKIQGIPHSARRTRAIRLDPANPAVVYAGTTEGLWRTQDGGDSWTRLTSPALIVNDLFVDPGNPSRLLLGADRAGVLLSADGGASFQPSNRGFAHRQVSQTVFDAASNTLYVAVLNDKEYGGVFATADHATWRQMSKGLEDRDVFALIYARTARGGRLLAGAGNGVLALDERSESWSRVGRVVAPSQAPLPGSDRTPYSRVVGRKAQAPARKASPRTATTASKKAPPASGEFNAGVSDFFQEGPGEPLYAATNLGVFRSTDAGNTWQRLAQPMNASTVVAQGKTIIAGVPDGLKMSVNGGTVWFRLYLPTTRLYAHINTIALAGKIILVATDAGLFRSSDMGGNWDRKGSGLPYNVPITSVRMMPGDPSRVFAAAPSSGRVYVSRDAGNTFEALEVTGLNGRSPRALVFAARKGAATLELVVSSAMDGLFARPLDSPSASLPRPVPGGR